MITLDQLDTLRDIFQEWDEDVLLNRINISHDGCRNITISIDHAGWQECCELFPDGEGGYDRSLNRPVPEERVAKEYSVIGASGHYTDRKFTLDVSRQGWNNLTDKERGMYGSYEKYYKQHTVPIVKADDVLAKESKQ